MSETDARQDGREAPPAVGALEQLLGMAAVDPRLGEALIARRAEVAAASGIRLSASEEALLRSVPDAALGQMAAGIGKVLTPVERRAFLQRAGAALLVLGGAAAGVGVGGAAAGCGSDGKAAASRGSASSSGGKAPDPRDQAAMDREEAERRAALEKQRRVRELRAAPPTGIVPDLPPSVYPLGVEVQGALDTQKVWQALSAQTAPVLRCYVKIGLAQKPNLAGELRLQAAVRSSGAFGKVTVKERYLQHPPTEKCALEAVRAWRVPAPTDGKAAGVTFRLIFTPGHRRR